MKSYLSGDDGCEVDVPPNADPAALQRTMKALMAPGLRPRFANVPSVAACAGAVSSAKHVERLFEIVRNTPAHAMAFLRSLPEARWPVLRKWPIAPVRAMAVIRGLGEGPYALELTNELEHADDSELRALLHEIPTDRVATVSIADDARAATQRLLSLADPEQIAGLQAKLKMLTGEWNFLPALSDDALAQLPRFEGDYLDACLRFERLRRGFIDAEALRDQLAVVDGLPQIFGRYHSLWGVPAKWARVDYLRALIAAGRHAAPFAEPLRTWHQGHRETWSRLSELHPPGAMFLFAVICDEDAVDWLANVCNADKAWFGKSHQAGWFHESLADALVSRPDGEQILDELAARLDGKTLAGVVEQARVRLANNRVESGQSAEGSMNWGLTREVDALRRLASSDDPLAFAEQAFVDSDPVGHLNAFVTALHHEFSLPTDRRSAPERGLEFVERAIRALELSYTETAPDGKALGERIGGHHAAQYRFSACFNPYLQQLPRGREAFVDEVLLPLYTASENPVFRGWVEPYLTLERPTALESARARFDRLTTALAGDGDRQQVALVLRSSQSPAIDTTNRLFGRPIGVAADRIPTWQGAPMAHLLTLETRALAPELRASYHRTGVVAIAVFLSSLDQHQAFFPDSPHAAVLELTAQDLESGESPGTEPVVPGVLLEIVERSVPSAVFEGGVKRGALWELRKLLDRRDLLAPYRRSPRWVQGPEGSGTFLFDFDGSFAPEVNLGDMGTLFVFEDTAFSQG